MLMTCRMSCQAIEEFYASVEGIRPDLSSELITSPLSSGSRFHLSNSVKVASVMGPATTSLPMTMIVMYLTRVELRVMVLRLFLNLPFE
ncbi:hypothetical protein X777_02828 [Ooceraea biroi]|uniref:Uncharacterized protein n=1 Tax=Ooceraea biroi TaxID=2015173 RepID=A0A026X1Q9_OOCBI|nr:hypothetical protein X777_02828 [Ooceraea biroi]